MRRAAALAIATLAIGCRHPARSADSRSAPPPTSAAVAAQSEPAQRPLPPISQDAPPGTLTVAAFGARGDGVTNDRDAIQAAIDEAARRGGGVVYFPAGTFSVQGARSQYYCLRLPGHVTLRGEGEQIAILQQAPHLGDSVRLLYIAGDDNVLEDLTLDGNRGRQRPNAQRHGIFATDGQRLLVQRVTSRSFTGDGFYLYNGVVDARFLHVHATGNGRNGLTMGGAVKGTQIVSSEFVGNRAQQVDSEPGGAAVVSDTTITDSLLDGGGVSQDFVLTCSGSSGASRGRGWRINHNTINGGIFSVWSDDVVIADNAGTNPTAKASVWINRASTGVQIVRNRFRMTQTSVPAAAAIVIQGTAGSAPEHVLIDSNQLQVDYEQSFGIRADGALSVEITHNDLRGSGRRAAGYAGVRLRATVVDRDFERAVVNDNSIRDFGDRGVAVAGNATARLLSLDIRRNRFDTDAAAPSMTTAISLDDGTGAARDVAVADNQLGCAVTQDVVDLPAGAAVTSDDPAAGKDKGKGKGTTSAGSKALVAPPAPGAPARIFVKPSTRGAAPAAGKTAGAAGLTAPAGCGAK